MKLELKMKAIALRKKGLSYNKILSKIPASRSSLSLWLRAVNLSKMQKEKLLLRKFQGQYKGALAQKEKRIRKTRDIIRSAIKEFKKLYKNPLFLSGILLYWAEGDKHKAEQVKFTNSDPMMIRLMMRWFREICKVSEDKFRIAIHLHTLFTKIDVLRYWSKITRVPLSQFHKPYVKKTSLRFKKNVLYNGTCAILIHSKDVFRKIVGWKIALQRHLNLSFLTPRSSMDRTKDF